MVTIHAVEIEPGDVLAYDGNERRITRVDRRDGWAWPIATDDSGWAVALDHPLVEVRRIARRFTSAEKTIRDRDVVKRGKAAVL